MFTKHCFQPALPSCGFLKTVWMICHAIITCQPYYHHWLPILACHASCTCPAFAVVRRTWDAAILTDSSLSNQSLLLPLDNAVTNFELLTRIGKTLQRTRALFSGSIVIALHDQAQASSQALQRTEHYASVAYRLVYFIPRLLQLIVNQPTPHLQKPGVAHFRFVKLLFCRREATLKGGNNMLKHIL